MRNIIYTFFCVLLLTTQSYLLAQRRAFNEDSLLKVYHQSTVDSVKFMALNKLFYGNRDNNTKNAMKYAKRMLYFADSVQNIKQLGNAYNCLSLAYTDVGEIDSALVYCYKYLNVNKQLGDSANVAGGYLNIGKLYSMSDKDSISLVFYKMSLTDFTLLKHKRGMALAYNNVATIYKHQKKYELALDYFRTAARLKLELNDKGSAASTIMNIGALFLSIQKPDSAYYYFRKALGISKESNNKRLEIQIYENLGDYHLIKPNFDSSEYYFNKALQMAHELNLKPDIADVYNWMVINYTRKKDFKNAFIYKKKYIIYRDSLVNEENEKQLQELQVKYETAQNDKKIQLLNEENKLSEEKIARSNSLILFTILVAVLFVFVFVLLFRQNKLTHQSNLELEQKNKIVAEQKLEITDSIKYAKKIQESLMPRVSHINKLLPNNFVIHKPKSIVSGDFYWIHKSNENIYVVLVDNLLHGVPGAFMSLVGMNLLNSVLDSKQIDDVVKIKRVIADEISEILKDDSDYNRFADKLAYSILKYNTASKTVEYLSADNPLYVLNNNKKIIELKSETSYKPTTAYNLQPGDTIYLFTDGFANQLGGKDGKKILNKRVVEFIESIGTHPIEMQKQLFLSEYNNWKGNYEQVDDIIVIAFVV